ncbi:hypothetical protein CAEBREN_22511 [Caenorhabditis brenneri]|uniref:F-box domain-containing protein n=1 Tax=Caenorhabditis brenneri TaxID=135651 RepID=G0NXJ3_CAEBE|nr:hypothetical protein CAEBREN_22511 [Caenorhabditis brenneri]
MSFPLRRLPFLAIREVIQSMDPRGIFEFSLVSKKSQNLVMLSIPKNSLSTGFTFRKDRFQFELMPKGFKKQRAKFFFKNRPVFTRFSTCGLYVQCELTGTSEVEETTRKLFYRFSKTFKNSKFSLRFGEETREEFAMEMMRFAWENGIPLNRINFYLDKTSPESIQELLNGCNGHYTSLDIETKIPEDFKCIPPPGGYKFKSFSVRDAHWVNLDDFLQCRKVSFWGDVPDWTVEYLNGLFKKIANLESRIEHFSLSLWNLPQITQVIRDFAQVVSGLSESAIERDAHHYKKLQFKRKDGLKLLISLAHGIRLKMTTF